MGSFRPCLPCVRGPGAELATIRCASKCLCCFFLRLTRPVRPLGSFPSSLRPSPCTSPPLAVADLPADNRRGGLRRCGFQQLMPFFVFSSLLFSSYFLCSASSNAFTTTNHIFAPQRVLWFVVHVYRYRRVL